MLNSERSPLPRRRKRPSREEEEALYRPRTRDRNQDNAGVTADEESASLPRRYARRNASQASSSSGVLAKSKLSSGVVVKHKVMDKDKDQGKSKKRHKEKTKKKKKKAKSETPARARCEERTSPQLLGERLQRTLPDAGPDANKKWAARAQTRPTAVCSAVCSGERRAAQQRIAKAEEARATLARKAAQYRAKAKRPVAIPNRRNRAGTESSGMGH
jgi:hypothetical protein